MEIDYNSTLNAPNNTCKDNVVQKIMAISLSACSLLNIIAYLATLVKVIRGSKYKFLISQILMLTISNVGTIATIFAFYEIFYSTNCNDPQSRKKWLIVLSCCQAVQDGFFAVPHWLFADKYYKIGMQMPLLVQGIVIPESTKKSDRRRKTVLLWLNIVMPIFAAGAFYVFAQQVLIK